MFPSPRRKQYLRWRQINRTLNDRICENISRDDLMEAARNLGLARGRRGIDADENDFALLMDHCLYDLRRRDKKNLVERFAASTAALTEDERRVLGQMCQAKFRMLLLYDEPNDHVFSVSDALRTEEIRFIDIGLSTCGVGDLVIVGHTIPTDVEDIWATTGAMLPIGPDDFADILTNLRRIVPHEATTLNSLSAAKWSEVARVTLRTAISNGCGEVIEFREAGSYPVLRAVTDDAFV